MRSQYRFLKKELFKQKELIALCCLILFLQAFFLVIFPLPIRFALDHALSPNANTSTTALTLFGAELSSQSILIIACVATLIIGILMTGFEFLDERFTSKSIVRLVSSMRVRLLDDLVTRQFSYLESKIKVDILGRLSGDTNNLELFVSTTLVVLCRSLPSLIFAIVSMFIINTQFALLMILLIPAFYASITLISKKIKFYEKDHRSKTNLFEHESLQTLSAISLLKSLQGEQEALRQLEGRQKQINASYLRSKLFAALLNATFSGSRHLIRALVLLMGGLSILKGHMTLGTLFAFVSYLEALNRPVGEIANFISRYGKASASLERVQELMEELSAHPEVDGTTSLKTLDKDSTLLEFSQMSFGYSEESLIFKNIDLTLERNKLIALVGPSGVGKSSFIKLLNRLNQPSNGKILLAGVSAQEMRLTDLRKHICLISQDPFFLSGTVRANLSLALPEGVSDDKLWEALEKVNAADFIKELPLGLDTKIGESGVQLSGGQSKRLSLARGFLRNDSASIFIFDEPTSGLDPVSATHVIKSLRELSEQKELVLFSTHRVQEFEIADEVLLFQKGEKPRLGTHETLLESNGFYRQLIRNEDQEVQA